MKRISYSLQGVLTYTAIDDNVHPHLINDIWDDTFKIISSNIYQFRYNILLN